MLVVVIPLVDLVHTPVLVPALASLVPVPVLDSPVLVLVTLVLEELVVPVVVLELESLAAEVLPSVVRLPANTWRPTLEAVVVLGTSTLKLDTVTR